jgi:hypothetical protein
MKGKKPSVSQTMTNSPGGIQAGRDVVIQRDKRIIQSLLFRIAVDVQTPETIVSNEIFDWGLGSVVALFTKEKTRIRFVTDFKVYDQQILPTVRRLRFVYTPETPQQIQGQPIEFLESINVLSVNYQEIFQTQNFALNNEPITLHLSVDLNGVNIGDLTASAPGGVKGKGSFDVSELFSHTTKTYNMVVSQTMTNSPGGIQVGGNLTVNQGVDRRKLTPEQRVRLIFALRDVPLKGPVNVMAVEGDSESIGFAEELAQTLEAAGWKVETIGRSLFTILPRGLFVIVHSAETAPKHAATLQYAFTNAGEPLPGQVYVGLRPGTVELLVGAHP